MSAENTNLLAEKIARLLRNETPDVDFRFLEASLEKINRRLENLENNFNSMNSNDFHRSSVIGQPSKLHPSQETFDISKAVGYQTPEQFETEKPCIFEPNGKPCDYCSMCSSRGF